MPLGAAEGELAEPELVVPFFCRRICTQLDQIIFPIETRESIFTQNRCLLEKSPVDIKLGEI
jgi:hypothetical protein